MNIAEELKIRKSLMNAAYPVMRVMEKIGKPEPRVTGEFYEFVRANIQSGDVLCSREDLRSTNLLIPGFWCHVGICVWIDGVPFVVEAVGSGVRKQSLAKWLLGKDHCLIVRKNGMSVEARALGGQKALTQIGKPYDYQLYYKPADKPKERAEFHEDSQKAFYCAELAYWGLSEAAAAMNEPFDFVLREVMGVLTVAPQDYEGAMDMGKFVPVALFKNDVMRVWEYGNGEKVF